MGGERGESLQIIAAGGLVVRVSDDSLSHGLLETTHRK
jgi:hypothetical protein